MPEGFSVDSYKLPTQQSPLDIAAKYGALKQQQQGIERQGIGIEKDKLDLMNQRFEILSKRMIGLAQKPDLNQDDIRKEFQSVVTSGFIPSEMAAREVSQIPPNATPQQLKSWLEQRIGQAQQIHEAVNLHYGVPGFVGNGQTETPVVTSPKFGVKPTGAPIQRQIPVEAQTIGPNGQPQIVGPQAPRGPEGSMPVSGGLPGQYRLPAAPPVPVGGPGAAPGRTIPGGYSNNLGGTVTGVELGPVERRPVDRIADGFTAPIKPAGPATGLPPGMREAETAVGAESGGDYSKALKRAANYQSDVVPLRESLAALENLGTKGTGPFTEKINEIKSFILSNVPGVTENDLKEVKDFDKAKKYLVQISRQSGGTGTNDQLAAAFAANPSVSISNAAAKDVVKTIYSLRRLEQAQTMMFQTSGLPASEYSKWLSKNQNVLDARAFGVDLMDKKSLEKLNEELKKNPEAMKKFNYSLNFAVDSKLVSPPGFK